MEIIGCIRVNEVEIKNAQTQYEYFYRVRER